MFPELKWLLPDGVDETLPEPARQTEQLRRQVLDLLAGWGFELVDPPLIEYLESLLSGVGEDLDLQTCKLVDQASGRMLGIRADMTPQVARIDAHRLKRGGPTRLCYVGPVLHNMPDRFLGSRNPIQIGAEIYGYAGIEADIEIATLLLKTLAQAGFEQVTLDIGHVGVVRGLVRALNLDAAQTDSLRDILNRKSQPELPGFIDGLSASPALAAFARTMPRLHGGAEVIAEAATACPQGLDEVTQALAELEAVVAAVAAAVPEATLTVDLAETRGYRYHTGLTFSAFLPGEGQEVAWGGRYDDIGSIFGSARPATGFSTDLKRLARLANQPVPRRAILAPALDDADLQQTVRLLRAQGEVVVQAYPGASDVAADYGCNARLARVDDGWMVEDLTA